jgi:C4-type Zn-finger protein
MSKLEELNIKCPYCKAKLKLTDTILYTKHVYVAICSKCNKFRVYNADPDECIRDAMYYSIPSYYTDPLYTCITKEIF